MTTLLTALQLKQLTADLNPSRIAHRAQGSGSGPKLSYLEAWDVRTALIRIFGYGGFSYETEVKILNIENDVPKRNGGGNQFRVTAMATVKLFIPQLGATYQEAAVSSQSQPDPGECADFAVKTAESDALKRCAVNLGTQFGLSLYNRGSNTDVVKAIIEPYQAAIVTRLQQGEKASAIDADLREQAGLRSQPVDVDAPDDSDLSFGYDPDHGETGIEGGGGPSEPQREVSPADRKAATDAVAKGFKRDRSTADG